MQKKIWVNKAGSFEDAQEFDSAYYRGMTSSERLEILQALREEHFKSTGLVLDESGKRLRRVLSIIKRT